MIFGLQFTPLIEIPFKLFCTGESQSLTTENTGRITQRKNKEMQEGVGYNSLQPL